MKKIRVFLMTVMMGANPSSFSCHDLPVENISWPDAVCCCNYKAIPYRNLYQC